MYMHAKTGAAMVVYVDVMMMLASQKDTNKRWRELEGEDPEQEALEAKIQVLEERLNYKKERNL